MRDDSRWPSWGPRAADEGLGSLLSIRLAGDGSSTGALNLYATAHGRFSEAETRDLALLFAVHAANALTSARLVEGLRTALDSRHTIGVAQGVLMCRYGVDLEHAFEVLTRYSNHLNLKVREVAEHVVEHQELPPLVDGQPMS